MDLHVARSAVLEFRLPNVMKRRGIGYPDGRCITVAFKAKLKDLIALEHLGIVRSVRAMTYRAAFCL